MRIPSTAPILRATSVSELFELLQAHSSLKGAVIQSDPPCLQSLSSVAGIAWWVATQRPELLERGSLDVLSVSTSTHDAATNGHWYAMLPVLLGMASLQVRVVVVGKGVCPSSVGAAAAAVQDEAITSVCSFYEDTLEAYVRTFPEYRPDLIALMRPQLIIRHSQLFGDDSALAAYINQGVPVLGGSAHSSEYVVDRLMLEAYGIREVSEPVVNPVCTVPLPTYTGVLYEVGGNVPVPATMSNVRHYTAARVLYTSSQRDDGRADEHLAEVGTRRHVAHPSHSNELMELVLLPHDYWLNPQTGVVYVLNPLEEPPYEQAVALSINLVRRALFDLPDEGAGTYERLEWGARVCLDHALTASNLSRHLQPDYMYHTQNIRRLHAEVAKGEENAKRYLRYMEMGDVDTVFAAIRQADMRQLVDDGLGDEWDQAIRDVINIDDEGAARVLLRHDPSRITVLNEEGDSLLHLAVLRDDAELVRELLKAGISPNVRDAIGTPILCEAVSDGHEEAFRALLEAQDLDLEAEGPYGETAMTCALQFALQHDGQAKMALLLKRRGASMFEGYKPEKSPLAYIEDHHESFTPEERDELMGLMPYDKS